MSSRRMIACSLVALLAMAAVASGEIITRLGTETASLFVHEPFAARLEIECDNPPDRPVVPEVPGLAVISVRQLPVDRTRRSHAFEISFIAERDGALILPSFEVRAGAETAMTPALSLLVRAPRPATEMDLAITVEPAALRVGEPATVSVKWTSAVPFSRCHQVLLEIPLLADERCQFFPLEPTGPESQRTGLPVNHLRVAGENERLSNGWQAISFRYILVPKVPCVLSATAARCICALVKDRPLAGEEPSYFYNQFFSAPAEDESYERIFLAARVPEIRVRALPETGRTSRFAEIVGPCAIRASIEPQRLVAGQPALLTIHLDHLAFARQLTGLPPAALAGLRADFQVGGDPIRESATDHTRSFTHVLRPLRPGISRVPAIVIQTFNPDSGAYQTLRSAPIPVSVVPDRGPPSVPVPRVDAQAPVPLNGVRHNRIDEQAMMIFGSILEVLGRCCWLLLPLPPLVWFALRPVARRWERCRRDPIFARAEAALRRFHKTAASNEEVAWQNYLADRLGLCAEALTAETVAEGLRSRTVDPALITETRRRFEDRDAADYGRRPAAPSSSTRDLVRRLHQATVPLLLMWSLLLPLRGNAAGSAEELFGRALQMREEKPDEAESLFVEAALGYESSGRFVNAGNSWFFAGASGRALACFHSAQQRWPFDDQVRESIEFLRANRADAFPAPTDPTGRLAAAWSRFCCWAAVLRVGLFVLIYLAAATLFLMAGLLGWRIPRAVWSLFAGAALLPLVSVAQTCFQAAEGVVIEDTVARLGPGYAYEPAFRQPLHQAAEFSWLETRQGWVRARLPGGAEGWLLEVDCLKVK